MRHQARGPRWPGRAPVRVALVVTLVWTAGWSGAGLAQSPAPADWPRIDWSRLEAETLGHCQALLRLDTRDPPGHEHLVVDYLKRLLTAEGVDIRVLARDAARPNLVARLKGNGRKRPLLLMSHTDVVTVDAAKWTHPPFGAVRDGGYVYGRGAVDDKDNLTAAVMTMLLLKRLDVPLDRDVILLAEAGEEADTSVGIDFVAGSHFPEIDAEYCLAEGGNVTRQAGAVRYATVQTQQKVARGIELVARGASGHGSIPLKSNAVVHLAAAVARIGAWRPEVRLNETTTAYFRRLAAVAPPEAATRYRDVLSTDARARAAADEWLFEHEPRHASMLRTSLSPNMFAGGYQINVIPSEAKATLDVRMLPDEDPAALLDRVKAVAADPAVDIRYSAYSAPPGVAARLDSEAFAAIEGAVTRVYDTVTLPMMGTTATDMAPLRARGIQCFGIGPAIDVEDGPRGFGQHSDQERLLEAELHRFVRFTWDVVTRLAMTP